MFRFPAIDKEITTLCDERYENISLIVGNYYWKNDLLT